MSDHIQCWICPKCHDDHRFSGPCTPKSDEPFTPSPDDHSYIADQYRNLQSQLTAEKQARERAETKAQRYEAALQEIAMKILRPTDSVSTFVHQFSLCVTKAQQALRERE